MKGVDAPSHIFLRGRGMGYKWRVCSLCKGVASLLTKAEYQLVYRKRFICHLCIHRGRV